MGCPEEKFKARVERALSSLLEAQRYAETQKDGYPVTTEAEDAALRLAIARVRRVLDYCIMKDHGITG